MSKTDKRSHSLELTYKGKKLFDELYVLKKDRYIRLIQNLSESEVKDFQYLLDKLLLNSDINLIK